jgi:hypothetical protein
VKPAWVVPLGGQLDLLAHWLEPIVRRPGLVAVPAERLHVVVGSAATSEPPELEPFDALVGPVRVEPGGVLADVIPVEPFLELRELLGISGPFEPQVVFAHADGTRALEPLEAVASEAVLVRAVTLLDLDA